MNLAPLKIPALVLLTIGAAGTLEKISARETRTDRVEVIYWEKWSNEEANAMRDVVDDFNKSQDKVYVKYLSVSGVDTKTLMATASGVPPDLAGLYDANLAMFADNHAVMPLDDMCKEAGITPDHFIKVYFNICNYRGHIYSLPTTPASTALHYNLDLLEQAGISRPPETTDEMLADSIKLQRKTKDGKSYEVFGFMPAEPGWWNWAWGPLFGGKLWDGHKTLTVNSKENIEGLEYVRKYSQTFGHTMLSTTKSGFGGFGSAQNAFMTGRVAMELQGVWMSNFIKIYNPKLRWAAAPYPYPPNHPEMKNSTLIGLDLIAIPTGAKHPKEAFEFLKYLMTQPVMEKLCLLQKKHSPLAQASPDFYKKHPNPYIKLFTELAKQPNAIVPPQTGMWAEFSQELGAAFDAVYLETKTPKQALDDVQRRMQPKFTEYVEALEKREAAEHDR